MADMHSTAPALRLMPCGPCSVGSEESTATEAPSMVPANVFKTRGHPLARMHGDFGVAFVGTKAELQAAGFGVGAVFPGEPGGNKKKAALPACNGFPRVEVELYGHCTYLGQPSRTDLQSYLVHAKYLAEKTKEVRAFAPTEWDGVVLHRSTFCDVYRGAMDALVAANLAMPQQFPGRPGCGKLRTTFSRDGERVTVGSNTASQEGNRTVLVVGKQFEVWIQVSEVEREARHALWSADFEARRARDAQDVAAFFSQHQAHAPRHHLRLVWSA
jgi:hypothetical protein